MVTTIGPWNLLVTDPAAFCEDRTRYSRAGCMDSCSLFSIIRGRLALQVKHIVLAGSRRMR